MRNKNGRDAQSTGRNSTLKTWRSYMGRTLTTRDLKNWKPYANSKSRKKPVKSNILSEQKEQELFCAWLDKNNIKYFAIPNGGYRKITEGVNLKRSGVKRGVPDVCIPIPIRSFTQDYHGAYIELKRVEKYSITSEQKDWITYLQSRGYFAEIAYGHKHAINLISSYLGL